MKYSFFTAHKTPNLLMRKRHNRINMRIFRDNFIRGRKRKTCEKTFGISFFKNAKKKCRTDYISYTIKIYKKYFPKIHNLLPFSNVSAYDSWLKRKYVISMPNSASFNEIPLLNLSRKKERHSL